MSVQSLTYRTGEGIARMTTTTKEKDSKKREFRIVKQKTQVSCGPACCLMMWANAYDMDPQADEPGVIALSRLFPKPWNSLTGSEINNLNSVMRQMGLRTKVETFTNNGKLMTALHDKVKPKKPGLVFVEWETDAKVIGHFVVIGGTTKSEDRYTVLDPFYGLQEMVGLPYYYPTTSETDPPSLKFTGACAFFE